MQRGAKFQGSFGQTCSCKNIHLFLNDLLKLILYLPSSIDLWAYFYCGFSSVSESSSRGDTC
jgi:hypothetical protein